jgi:membrane protease YdiL (CAAX protease family)
VPAALFLCAILVVTLVAVAIAGMALLYGQGLRHGQPIPPWGQFPGTAAARAIISLTVAVCAGFIEEAAFRGAIQLRLQDVVGAYRAEFIAGVLFVVLHADRLWLGTPAALLFITVSAFANGRLAAVTQTARYSALTHSLVNGVLVVILLALKE